MSTDSYQARQTLKAEKKAGTLINAAGRAKTLSAIYLDNGTVVSSPLTVQRLLTAIDKANAKEFSTRDTRHSDSIQVRQKKLASVLAKDLEDEIELTEEADNFDELA